MLLHISIVCCCLLMNSILLYGSVTCCLTIAHSMIFELVSSLGILAKLASLEQEILSLCGSIFFIFSW